MEHERRPEGEVGIAFTAPGNEPMVPEDTIGTVWLGNVNDRTGKRLFRGKIDLSKIPHDLDGNFVHIVMFPFTSGKQTGITIQASRKHHGKK